MNLTRATLAALFTFARLIQAQTPAPGAPTIKAPPGRPFDLADLSRLVGLADPQTSPDGRGVAVFVSRTNDKENRQDRELAAIAKQPLSELDPGTLDKVRDRLVKLLPASPELERLAIWP